MNDIQIYDEAAVARVMAMDTFKVSMYGRSAQNGLHDISSKMSRIADISGNSQEVFSSVSEAFKPLITGQKTSFMQRILGTAPAPMTVAELKAKVDIIVTTMVSAEQALARSKKIIEMTKVDVDKVYDDIHKKYLTLMEVAARTEGHMSKTAYDAAQEMTVSLQVAENMRLNLALIYKDVLYMQIRNTTILEDHVPLWDKIIDNLDAADVAAAEKLRLQVVASKQIAEEKKIDVPVAGTLEM